MRFSTIFHFVDWYFLSLNLKRICIHHTTFYYFVCQKFGIQTNEICIYFRLRTDYLFIINRTINRELNESDWITYHILNTTIWLYVANLHLVPKFFRIVD